jgi:GATA zinc finger domain-containing protein 1
VKKLPYKTPTSTATISTVDSLFYDKSYIQVGDIVSVIDKNEDVYYAQIRGLMVDSYCQKAAFLTWLIPTKSSPPPAEKFDPSSYLIGKSKIRQIFIRYLSIKSIPFHKGPEEDFPRKLSCMRFIMHAPSNYYFDKNTPYPTPDVYCSDTHEQNSNFIWSNINSLSQCN